MNNHAKFTALCGYLLNNLPRSEKSLRCMQCVVDVPEHIIDTIVAIEHREDTLRRLAVSFIDSIKMSDLWESNESKPLISTKIKPHLFLGWKNTTVEPLKEFIIEWFRVVR